MSGLGILKEVLWYFGENGLSKKNLVSVATDGAGAMTGKNIGFTTLIKQNFPGIIGMHCINHRVNLVVNDFIKYFKEF